MFIVFGRDISLLLWTLEIFLRKNNSRDLHRVIIYSLVLVIVLKVSIKITIFTITQSMSEMLLAFKLTENVDCFCFYSFYTS